MRETRYPENTDKNMQWPKMGLDCRSGSNYRRCRFPGWLTWARSIHGLPIHPRIWYRLHYVCWPCAIVRTRPPSLPRHSRVFLQPFLVRGLHRRGMDMLRDQPHGSDQYLELENPVLPAGYVPCRRSFLFLLDSRVPPMAHVEESQGRSGSDCCQVPR